MNITHHQACVGSYRSVSGFTFLRPESAKEADNLYQVNDMSRKLCIFIGGSDRQNGDYSMVHRLVRRGGVVSWSSLKDSRPGDRVLIYIRQPHSALIAKAEVTGRAQKGTQGDYAYRARTGRFRLLRNPLTLHELQRVFPRWGWLRYPRGKAVVPPQYAKRLWELVDEQPAAGRPERSNGAGAGFGDAKTNALVETAAVRQVTRLLQRRGFRVKSVESDRVGYDLHATKGTKELLVEVKGVSGDGLQFLITRNELKAAAQTSFRLMVVTQARTRQARVHEFHGPTLKRRFSLEPVSYFAKRK
jgi:hypothetical protein